MGRQVRALDLPTTDGVVLPTKKDVRRREALGIGDFAQVQLSLV